MINKKNMFTNLRKQFLNRMFIHQHYFEICHKFFLKKDIKDLFENGYSVYNKKFPLENIDLNKYLNYSDYDFVVDRKKIENVDLKKIYTALIDLGVISMIKNYLGKKIYVYDNSILTLGNKNSYSESMQPHHDSKYRRVKIYIWLNDKNLKTHPLYYLKRTHKQIKLWHKYDETRFPNLDQKKFDAIYGEKGSIIFFDTHGIHSHFKTTNVPRSVMELSFESFGFLNRLNKRNIKNEINRLNLIDLDEIIFLGNKN